MFDVFNIHNSCSVVPLVAIFRKMDVQVVNVRRSLQTTVTIAAITTTIMAKTTTITAKTIISELGAECKPGPSEIVAVERAQEAEVVL